MSYFADINENNDKVQTDKKITWNIATESLKSKFRGFVPKGQGSIKKGKDLRILTGYQVGYVFTYLGMYTYLFQKLGM